MLMIDLLPSLSILSTAVLGLVGLATGFIPSALAHANAAFGRRDTLNAVDQLAQGFLDGCSQGFAFWQQAGALALVEDRTTPVRGFGVVKAQTCSGFEYGVIYGRTSKKTAVEGLEEERHAFIVNSRLHGNYHTARNGGKRGADPGRSRVARAEHYQPRPRPRHGGGQISTVDDDPISARVLEDQAMVVAVSHEV